MNTPDDEAPEALRRRCAAAERELQLLRTLLDLVPDFFYVHDQDLRYRYANRAAAEYFGVPKEELVGRRLREVERDAEQARFYETVCRAIMAEGQPKLTTDLPLRLQDGSVRYLRQYDVPFRDPAGGEPLLFGLARDITAERDLIEERVRRERAERDLEIAQAIQRSILPRGPLDVGGFRVGGACVPSHYAAGDFYDWSVAANGDVTVCVGDVAGHGIGPAILAAACKAYGRSLLDASVALASGMARLNRAMSAETLGDRFVTLAAVRLDAATGIASLVSAGHGPVLHYVAATGTVVELPTHGLPLAIDADAGYDPATVVPLAPGDALLVLSDGLSESRGRHDEMYGLERVKADVLRHGNTSAEALATFLIATALAHAATPTPDDDMTAVVVQWSP